MFAEIVQKEPPKRDCVLYYFQKICCTVVYQHPKLLFWNFASVVQDFWPEVVTKSWKTFRKTKTETKTKQKQKQSKKQSKTKNKTRLKTATTTTQ